MPEGGIPVDARIFATTLRSQRARQKSAVPQPRWVPRFARGPTGAMDRLIGAQVDMSQLWLTVPRRTVRQGRKRSGARPQRDFDFELLRTGCAQAASWPEEMRLLVALEDEQAPDSAFNFRLSTVLEQSGFSASRLDLVFPESGLAQDVQETCYTLSSLRDRGARILMNGFGSGPSSLTLLRERAVGGLIDGVQFDVSVLPSSSLSWLPVGDLPELDETAVAFFRAALEAASALSLDIRAVNVDSAAQLGFVERTGCSEASGALLAGPETGPQIAERFAALSGQTRRRRMPRTAEGL